jgi:hypothetical protein
MIVLKVKCQTYVGTVEGENKDGCGSDASNLCLTLTYVVNTIKPSSIFIKTSTSCDAVTVSNTFSITSSDSNLATAICSTSFKFIIGSYEVTLSKIEFFLKELVILIYFLLAIIMGNILLTTVYLNLRVDQIIFL